MVFPNSAFLLRGNSVFLQRTRGLRLPLSRGAARSLPPLRPQPDRLSPLKIALPRGPNEPAPSRAPPRWAAGRFRWTKPAAGLAPGLPPQPPAPGRAAQHGGAPEEEEAPQKPAPRCRRQPHRLSPRSPAGKHCPTRRDTRRSGGLSTPVPAGSPTEAGRAGGNRSPCRFLIHPAPGGAGTAEQREPRARGRYRHSPASREPSGDRGHCRVPGAVPRVSEGAKELAGPRRHHGPAWRSLLPARRSPLPAPRSAHGPRAHLPPPPPLCRPHPGGGSAARGP